jgi:hypothetical protein
MKESKIRIFAKFATISVQSVRMEIIMILSIRFARNVIYLVPNVKEG